MVCPTRFLACQKRVWHGHGIPSACPYFLNYERDEIHFIGQCHTIKNSVSPLWEKGINQPEPGGNGFGDDIIKAIKSNWEKVAKIVAPSFYRRKRDVGINEPNMLDLSSIECMEYDKDLILDNIPEHPVEVWIETIRPGCLALTEVETMALISSL